MTTFTALLDAILAQDKPLTQAIARALRDNPLAIAEGSAGSPSIIGLNLADVQIASNATSLIFTSLTGAFDVYEFEILNLLPQTSTAFLQMQYSTNGGSTWNNGSYVYSRTVNDGTLSADVQTSQTQFKLSQPVGSGQTVNGKLLLFQPGSTSLTKKIIWEMFHGSSSGNYVMINAGGDNISAGATTNAVNAIKFFFSSGNISSGKIAMRPRRPVVTN